MISKQNVGQNNPSTASSRVHALYSICIKYKVKKIH